MPIETSWYQEPHIRLTRDIGMISAADIETWAKGELVLLEQTSHPVHMIVDMSEMGLFAPNLTGMPIVFQLLKHKQLGWIIFVKTNRLVNMWIEVFARLTQARFKRMETIADAAEFLNQLMQIHKQTP